MSQSNTDLWDKVCKTDPGHTKSANVRGNKITAIAPQYQILKATEQFGPYGGKWGFKRIYHDYSLVPLSGVIVFHGDFFSPVGEFPITSSISAFVDNAKTKPDHEFAKKVETDALTKALSKLGFNADVFMGLYDDHKYVSSLKAEFAPAEGAELTEIDKKWVEAAKANIKVLDGETVTPEYKQFILEQLK